MVPFASKTEMPFCGAFWGGVQPAAGQVCPPDTLSWHCASPPIQWSMEFGIGGGILEWIPCSGVSVTLGLLSLEKGASAVFWP